MSAALEKPRFGQPCNGCGICCRLQRCHFGVEIFGAGDACPALEDGGHRTWCGVLRNPENYLGVAAVTMSRKDLGRFQVAFASALAIGSGCDSSDEAVAEVMRRSSQVPQVR